MELCFSNAKQRLSEFSVRDNIEMTSKYDFISMHM